MAYERLSDQKVISTNLNGFINSQLILLKNQRTQRNLDDESRFQSAVLEDNLSLEDQLKYRTEQLTRVKATKDKTEINRVKEAISGIKDQIEAKAYTDAYTAEINSLNSGASSIDQTISWLNDRLSKTTDPAIQKNIQDNLTQLIAKRYQLQQDTLDKQTTYATNNKSEKVLSDQIDKVSAARKSALLSGDDNYVAVLDLQLQNLKKSLNETQISNTLLNFATSTLTGQSSLSLLDAFNKQISSADATTPVTIGGVRYDNAQQYWNTRRADFLNDNSDNGFFGRYKNEITANMNTQISKGTFTTDSLKQASDAYDTLRFRPELTDYANKIDQQKTSTMQTVADARSTQILNKFATNLDAKTAVQDLSTIQDTYGIDQTKNYQTIIIKAGQEKTEQLNSLLAATSSIMSSNPGMTQEQAFAKAVQSGAGVTYSPQALATKTPEELFKAGKDNPAGTTPPLTVDINAEGKTFQKPNLAEGEIYKLPNSATGYIYQGGQLKPLADTFTDEELKQATGKSFSQIQTVDSFGNTPIGPAVTKSQLITPTPAPAPSPEPQPDKAVVPGTTPAPAAPAVQQQTYVVKAGDTLSSIAKQYYQDPNKYQQIFDANKDVLKNPNQIKAGQSLKIPSL